MIAIKTTDLTKRFPRSTGYRDLLPFRHRQWVTAVDGASLDIEEGELFGLLGPNGAGKTTLIKLLCSLVLPTSGSAQVFGHDVRGEEQAVKELVGLVSAEERSFFWRLTGRENLGFYACLYHMPRPEMEERIDEVLALVGLTAEDDIRFQNYSTGMRQKLAIARGLLSRPKLLFVDEPTRSLDPLSAQAIRQFLKDEVAGAGTTVVLATHNMDEAEQLCDRLAIMDHGRVIALGSVQELRSLFQRHELCELEVSDFPQDIEGLLSLAEGVMGCRRTGQQNGVLSLELELLNRPAVLPEVLRIIVHSGGQIRNCRLRELALEEIFVQALRAGTADEELRHGCGLGLSQA